MAAQRKSIPRGLRPGFGVGVCGPRLKLWGAGGLFELVIERLFEAATSVKDARNCYQARRFLNLEQDGYLAMESDGSETGCDVGPRCAAMRERFKLKTIGIDCFGKSGSVFRETCQGDVGEDLGEVVFTFGRKDDAVQDLAGLLEVCAALLKALANLFGCSATGGICFHGVEHWNDFGAKPGVEVVRLHSVHLEYFVVGELQNSCLDYFVLAGVFAGRDLGANHFRGLLGEGDCELFGGWHGGPL